MSLKTIDKMTKWGDKKRANSDLVSVHNVCSHILIWKYCVCSHSVQTKIQIKCTFPKCSVQQRTLAVL